MQISKILGYFFLIGLTFCSLNVIADTVRCVKPLTIPDKWVEKQTPPFDGSDTFATVDSKGNPLSNPDIYIAFGQPGYTGYSAADVGTPLVLTASDGTISPGSYFPVALPSSIGGGDYRANISGCSTATLNVFDPLNPEPGNKAGPTSQGITALIAQDPSAHWDTGCNCVAGSAFAVSPRVMVIPVYDPAFYEVGKQHGRNADFKVGNFIGFFVEGIENGGIVGRIASFQ